MAKIVYEVVADTKKAESSIDKFAVDAKNKIESSDPKFDLVDDSSVEKFDKQIEYLEIKANELRSQLDQMSAGNLEGDFFKTGAELEKTQNQLARLRQKQDEIKGKEQEVGAEIDKNNAKRQQANNENTKHGFGLDGLVKKLTRVGLAVIGVRSAYMGIRRAISLVAGSNDAISQKMEQMRNVLVATITPIVETIVNFLMKAMVYVNYITKTLFGKAIFDFSKATANTSKNMASTAKSAGSTAKSLKQASKQLAGFDEMNVLTDNNSSGGGGTGGVGGVGGLDTSGLKDMKNLFDDISNIEVPNWVKQLTDNWVLKTAISGWKAMIDLIKEKQRLDQIEKDNEAGKHADNLKRQKSLEKEGTQIIKNAKAQKQMTDQEFVYIRGIEEEIIGLTKKGKLTDSEKERLRILSNRYGDLYREGALNNSQMELYRVITGRTKTTEAERVEVMKNLTYQSIEEYKASKNVADGADQVANSTKNGNYWVDKYGVTLETMTKRAGLSKEQTDKLRDALNKYDKSDKGMKALDELVGTIEKVGKKAGLSKDEIGKLGANIMGLKSKKITVDTTLSVTDIKEKTKGFITSSLKKSFGAKGMVIGYNKGGIVKYASGGIINQPGRGVPLPIGGEHGMEGVVPLTDSQQMALLGEAIGKYITINANITNTMNGRIISRELQKIQNEESFASNRW